MRTLRLATKAAGAMAAADGAPQKLAARSRISMRVGELRINSTNLLLQVRGEMK